MYDMLCLGVRKIFSDRARIVVYLEQAEVPVMVAKAREEGKTLVEWAREVLRGEISQDVRGVQEVRVARQLHRTIRLDRHPR